MRQNGVKVDLAVQECNVMEKKDINYSLEQYKAIRDAIDNIMVEFDFNKVYDIIQSTSWFWAMEEDGKIVFRIPTLQEVKSQALRLLRESAEVKQPISAGGFETELLEDEFLEYCPKDHKWYCHIGLKFVAASINSWF